MNKFDHARFAPSSLTVPYVAGFRSACHTLEFRLPGDGASRANHVAGETTSPRALTVDTMDTNKIAWARSANRS